VKVHQDWLDGEPLTTRKYDRKFWRHRYDDINAFERHLTRNGTAIVKFFLNVSPEEQQKRFLERINNPAKHWKFAASDVQEREFWNDYMRAYEECLSATSTKSAPWYVIPADHKWVTRALVSVRMAATRARVTHLWSAGMTYQGADLVLVAARHSS
jgi:polyphosphate kinase 2 (PPK2 family)